MRGALSLKRHVDFYSGAAFPQDEQGRQDGELPFVKVSDLGCDGPEVTRAESTVDLATARRLGARPAPRGTIVFPKVGAALLTNRRRILGCTAVFDNNVMGFRPKANNDPRWFYYWSTTLDMTELANPGALPSVTVGQVGSVAVAVPGERIQRVVADYLDSETARIDALIDRKQRFIDLLLEKRTALITHAVTKGVDPNAEMVDSGIEWIGSVPAHWGVGRLKDLAPFVTSGSRGWAQYYADDGPMFLRITNLPRGGSVDLLMEDLRYVDVPAGAEGARTQVQEGDILISITAEMGAVAVVPCGLGEAYVSQHVALTRPKRSVDSRWLAYVMASNVGCQHYENRLYGGTKIQLSLDDVRETPIPIPPIAECMAIKEHLDRETSQLGVLVDKTRVSIDLLREYRTALISAAVTGQIDIPGTDETEDVA